MLSEYMSQECLPVVGWRWWAELCCQVGLTHMREGGYIFMIDNTWWCLCVCTVKPDELVELKPFEETDCLEPFKLKLKPNIFL